MEMGCVAGAGGGVGPPRGPMEAQTSLGALPCFPHLSLLWHRNFSPRRFCL